MVCARDSLHINDVSRLLRVAIMELLYCLLSYLIPIMVVGGIITYPVF